MLRYKWKVIITQVVLVLLSLILWEIGTRNGVINSFIYSSPTKVLTTIIELIKNGTLVENLKVTFLEVIVSFTLGLGIAFIISILMYLNKFLSDVIDPFLTMLNSMPKVALGPIIIIWVGANKYAIITMALLINVIISIITIYHGFINTNELQIKMFKTFKANKWQILTKLVIPANISTIISALKINISLTFIGVIMGEFLVSKKGIGYLILFGTQVFNLNLVIAGIFILIILSFIIYELITLLEKKTMH